MPNISCRVALRRCTKLQRRHVRYTDTPLLNFLGMQDTTIAKMSEGQPRGSTCVAIRSTKAPDTEVLQKS